MPSSVTEIYQKNTKVQVGIFPSPLLCPLLSSVVPKIRLDVCLIYMKFFNSSLKTLKDFLLRNRICIDISEDNFKKFFFLCFFLPLQFSQLVNIYTGN